MAIGCVYCGGEHDHPREVRDCWSRHEGDPSPGDPSPRPEVAPRGAVPPAAHVPAAPVVPAARRGPAALGRHVLVGPGDDPPAPWAGCERVTITAADVARPDRALAALRSATHTGRSVVIELADAALDRAPRSTTAAPPHEVGARHGFDADELHHLVHANAIDARAAEPRWALVDAAVALGARVDGPADVVLPDGRPAWLDGGPPRVLAPVDGAVVVHAVSIEHGSLEPPVDNASAADLAPDQLAAVTHASGSARIVAPAGSGKTRVLTERARHLVTRWRVPASAVALVAFNKRAQEEMAARTADVPGLQVRTLNSIALAVVNGVPPFAPRRARLRTVDEGEVRRAIGGLVRFPRRRNTDPIAPWIEALGLVRLGLVPPEEAEARADGEVSGLAEVWPRFRDTLERSGAIDFDGQIHRAVEILLGDADARLAAQRACRHLLVDEFQDLTPAHLLLVRLLSGPGGAVFGVGDDDQTIYGYNGADPAWLIDFAELFPGAGSHPLEVNYRCPPDVVEAVDRLLRHNRRRVPKAITTPQGAGDGIGAGWSVETSDDPVADSVRRCAALLGAGRAPTEVAVLTRVNAVLAPIQVALSEAGVGIAGGVGLEFCDRTSVRAALAWLRLATAPARGASLAGDDLDEALRRPSRSLHPRIAGWVTEQRDLDGLARLAGRLTSERDADRVADLAADVAGLQGEVANGATTSDLVAAIADDIGLAGAVASLDATRHGMNRSAQGDDLAALRQAAALHDDPLDFERWLRDLLAVRRSPDGVTLATVHRVKGQEWPFVVVHLADDARFPHRLADDLEEERRLFHVALTRAAEHVAIVTGPRPSPFVAELTTEPRPGPVGEADPRASERPPERARARAEAPVLPDPDTDPVGARLVAELRSYRDGARDGKPAYVVFDDRTLAEIATTRPASRSELAAVRGIGPAKLERYGDDLLRIVAAAAARS